MSSVSLREGVWTEADLEEMERLAVAGIGKMTRIPKSVNRILNFKIGERCIQAQDGDTVYMVTNELRGWKHVAYYRNKEVGWTELGRGLLTECIEHCLVHLNKIEPIPSDRERFVTYLEWATKEVATWPEWKQNVLGSKQADAHRQADDNLDDPPQDNGNSADAQTKQPSLE